MGENPGIFTQGTCHIQWIADTYGLRLAGGYPTECRGENGDKTDVDKEDCTAKNGKKCQFGGLSFQFGSNTVTGGTNSTGGVTWDKCLLGAQASTAVQMDYRCLTLDIDEYKQCCSDNSELCEKIEGQLDFEGGIDILEAGALFAPLLANCSISLSSLVSTCGNNCPGVRASDIVVGGSAIILGTSFAALAPFLISPVLVYGAGAVSLASTGAVVSQQLCLGPFYCTTQQGSCCVVVFTPGGIRCPPSC